MGQIFKFLIQNGFGSIGETARAIIAPVIYFDDIDVNDEDQINGMYMMILGQRAQAGLMAGATDSNYLLDFGIDKYFEMYNDCFGQNAKLHKKDLPLFTFTAMYLESKHKREAIKAQNQDIKIQIFEVIHEECMRQNSDLVMFSKIENTRNGLLFLSFLEMNLASRVMLWT